jgi:hypothetical protein
MQKIRRRSDYLDLRHRYEPKEVGLVIIGESPPASGKYFYDPEGKPSEPLFAALMRQLGLSPRTKEEGLRDFQLAGWVLIDATYEPVNTLSRSSRNRVINRDYELLRDDLATLMPNRQSPIVLMKANVCRKLESGLAKDGFNVLNAGRILCFPSTGWQKKFQQEFSAVLKSAGLLPLARQLPSLECPRCGCSMTTRESVGEMPSAKCFQDCLRRCERCGIGASNAKAKVTWICLDPLQNIPPDTWNGAKEALAQALNETNRESKLRYFGFSTSEDAVTWVVFTQLLRSGKLIDALKRAGIVADQVAVAPTLLLWGVPVNGGERGKEIRQELHNLCTKTLGEKSDRLTEPDVIIDLGEDDLVFIEVKYLGDNDSQPTDYKHWPTYEKGLRLAWHYEDVKASRCYELARNWRVLKELAGERPTALVNLGQERLFRGVEGERLCRFAEALGLDERSRFKKIRWREFLDKVLDDQPEWFADFCRDRGLLEG